jgi:flagellar hook-associated protein 2
VPSSIGFGNLRTDGSTVRLFGTSSGIETDRLVDALVEAKRLPAVRIEKRIAQNEAKIAALNELRGLLRGIRDAVAGLRNPPGILGIDGNLFEKKDVFFSSDTTTRPNELVGVGAANRAQPGTFRLVVERLATAHRIAADPVASRDQTLADAFNGGAGFSGTFSLGLAGGPTAEITVDGSMDLDDLAAAIDAKSGTTGVQARVLKVSDTDYRLVLTAAETGRAIELAHVSGDNVPDLVGLTTGGGSFANVLQVAQSARVRIDGVAIERSSNLIDDAVAGVTLNLFRADPATTVTVEVQRSAASVREKITAFVEAWNAFRDFLARQSQISDSGEVSKDAVLFGDSTLRAVAGTLGGIVTSDVAGLDPGALSSLAAIGIRLDPNNRLTIDDKRLDDALLGKPDQVRRLFEFTFESSSPDLRVFSRTNALADTRFTVDIVDADGDGVIESATIDGVAADVSGGRIRGRAGTPYEGLTLLWAGRGSTSIGVTATQGIADRLYNAVEAMLDDIDGTVTRAAGRLSADNERHRADIARIDERVERFRRSLIDRFAALERTLSMLDTLLGQVRAQAQAFFGKDK